MVDCEDVGVEVVCFWPGSVAIQVLLLIDFVAGPLDSSVVTVEKKFVDHVTQLTWERKVWEAHFGGGGVRGGVRSCDVWVGDVQGAEGTQDGGSCYRD
jgi:hypothetical protein